MNKRIPIVYAFVYYRIRKHSKTEHITLKTLKEAIGRGLVRHAGFPRMFIKYVIKDLVYFGLLEKENKSLYKILDSDCDKKIKNLFPFF
jgi:predicted transcriptional regulator